MIGICKTLAPIFTSLAVLLLTTAAMGQNPDEAPNDSKVRVGTFDSRAVAIAYYRSKPFKDELHEKFAGLEKAKTAGDEKRVKELEAEGPALQELMHLQSFGTWPIDDVLKKIKNEVPKIAKQAKVQVIVSKWDITYQQPGIELVDVTELMVKPFEPDAETLKVIKEIQEKAPIPSDVLKKHEH